jgi:hypothetical protein
MAGFIKVISAGDADDAAAQNDDFHGPLYIRRRVLSGSTDGCAGYARNPGESCGG